jgi:DNA-binding LytR/AlgR family response regulator
MTAKRILIVEDEFIIAQNLRQILTDLAYEVAGHAYDAQEALEILGQGTTDLALLDISLGRGMDGIALAGMMRDRYSIPIIFLTSHSDRDTIERAKEVRPAGFIVKPFHKAEIFAAIEIAFANAVDREPPYLFVRVDGGQRKVLLQDITFLKADRVYVEIHCVAGHPLIVRESLHVWEERLPATFLRVNRSYVVNLQHVSRIDTDSITLGSIQIHVSRAMRDQISNQLNARGPQET